uniref:Uncharacterized protein n=1 Tax=viral metagenome TaxID=1070528 RepID=A0A6C0JE69_9ZZZZ
MSKYIGIYDQNIINNDTAHDNDRFIHKTISTKYKLNIDTLFLLPRKDPTFNPKFFGYNSTYVLSNQPYNEKLTKKYV